MFGLESLSGNMYAAALVGLVLVEAMILYVGYGGLTRVLGPVIKDAVGGN
jgi:hypothetical protein